MFPLGRYIAFGKDDFGKKELNCGEVKYLLQPIQCGDKSEIHTVREWFGDFDISLEDTAFVHWNQAMSIISMKLNELEMQLDMLPLSKSMLVYTVLTQFAWPWSDVLLPKLLLKDRNMWTVAVGLFNLPETHFSRFAAGSVFIAIPIVILYFCLVKHIVNGLTAGSVKG